MNLQTFIIASIIAVIFVAIIIKAIRDKKKGTSSCASGGGCSGCAMSSECHPKSS